MRFVVLLIIFLSNIIASPLIIDENFDQEYASSSMHFYHDKNATFSLKQLNNVSWQPMHSSNLSGAKDFPTWTLLELSNNTNHAVTLFLKNPRAGMDVVDAYVLHSNFTKIHYLGDKRALDLREIPCNYSVLRVELSPHEKVKIVTRLVNQIGSTEGEWIVYSSQSFYKSLLFSTIWWGIFAGTILVLFFYAVPILLAARDRLITVFFLFYVLSSLSYQFSVNGFFYLFGFPPEWVNFTVLFTAISFGLFGILFVMRYLQIEKYMNIIYKMAVFFAALLILEYIFLIIGIFDKSVMSFVGTFNVYVGLVAYVVWFAMLRHLILVIKDKIFRYLFGGYTIVIIAYAAQALVSAGWMKINIFSIYGVSVATLFEIMFFVFGIQQYIHQLQIDQKRKDRLIDFQMQFASIGRVIGNIVHQWKIPLVRTGSLLTQVESLVHFKSDTLHRELEEIIPKCRTNLAFMSQTVHEFYNLYSTPAKCEVFPVARAIHDIWDMLAAKALSTNAKLVINDPLQIHTQSYSHAFSHIIMILLDNVLNAAEARSVRSPLIEVKIELLQDRVSIEIKDNCGGIEQKPIDSIFEIDVSTKSLKEELGGLGLPMAKLLVEERMAGNISVINVQEGAFFNILFPNQPL